MLQAGEVPAPPPPSRRSVTGETIQSSRDMIFNKRASTVVALSYDVIGDPLTLLNPT
jgi:hypothetical protein